MGQEHQRIIAGIVEKTDSDLILFFVLLLLATACVCLPLYKTVKAGRSQRMEHENKRQERMMEREKLIIGVISANSEIIAGLKTTLEMTSANIISSFDRVHDRLDDHGFMLAEQGAALSRKISLDPKQ